MSRWILVGLLPALLATGCLFSGLNGADPLTGRCEASEAVTPVDVFGADTTDWLEYTTDATELESRTAYIGVSQQSLDEVLDVVTDRLGFPSINERDGGRVWSGSCESSLGSTTVWIYPSAQRVPVFVVELLSAWRRDSYNGLVIAFGSADA